METQIRAKTKRIIRICKEYKQQVTMFGLIFFALFFSSMLGAKIFGISLNKLALLPLEAVIVYYVIKNRKIYGNKNLYSLFGFYIVQIAGSLFAIVFVRYNNYVGYYNRLITNVIQNVFIYIPILFGLGVLREKFPLYKYFKRALLWVVRIHCVWAIIQFLFWNIFDLNINEIIFKDFLNGFIDISFEQILINIKGKTQIRAAGLTIHVAFAALMMMGVCFEKNYLLKLLYCLSCVLSMSRTGIVASFGLFFFQLICLLFSIEKSKRKKIFCRGAIISASICVIFLLGYLTIPFVKEQVNNVLDRFLNINSNKDGSKRHVMYPIYAVFSWIVDLNLFQKIWGIGARVSGLVFVNSNYVSKNMIFNNEMLTTAWEVECDFAAILLGDGIVGFAFYLCMLYILIKSKNRELASLGLGLFVFGIMSAAFSNTLIQITLIFVFVTLGQKHKTVENKQEKIANNTQVSVIIVSYKNVQILRDCLDSIKQYNDIGDRLEVIVSDNSEDNLLYDTIKAEYDWIKIIKNENKGFGAGNNRGYEIATGDYLLFLNPDTILIEPIFDFAIQKFVKNQRLGLFGVKLLDKDLKPNPSFFKMDGYGVIATLTSKLFRKIGVFVEGEFFVSGADLFVRRTTFEQAGLFDENIFMYKEEPDLIKRIKRDADANEVSYFSKKKIIHLEGGTQEKSEEQALNQLSRILTTDIYYNQKWGISCKKIFIEKRRYEKFKKFIYKILRKKEMVEFQNKIIGVYNDYLLKLNEV